MENHSSMKITIPSTYKKQILPLGLFISFSLIIWFIGPLVAIANHAPLEHPEKRIYIIAALFLLWLLKFIFLEETPTEKGTAPTSEIAKKLQTLQGRFQGALNFLKKTTIQKQDGNFSLSHLPWYLLIGPKGAGKTTLLANANINFILSKQFKQAEAIQSSDACDWWVTRDLVLIDVPGSYFFTRKKLGAVTSILWNALLNLVKTTPASTKLNGVIIALNLPEILNKIHHQKKDELFYDLKKRITDLRNQFGPQLSFQFVITKCDLLPGFLEFFGESVNEELSQTWGLTMPALSSKEKWLDVFTLRFNALIKQINKQLLWRLHQEHNPNAKPYIKDFPLHLERLKESLIILLKALAMPVLCLQGVYLTSAVQSVPEETVLSDTQTMPGHLTHQALQLMRAPSMPSRPYFIKQLVLQTFLYSPDKPASIKQGNYHWQRRALYAASIGIIVTTILLLGHDFQQNASKTYALENELAHYQTYVQRNDPSDTRLIKALPLLDALQQSANYARHPFTRSILSFYSNKSQETATHIYAKALQTIVVPEIKSILEKYLKTASNKNPVPVYTALKAYLMLADPDNFQASFITNTLDKIDELPISKQALNQLTTHIEAIFLAHALAVDLDQDLIAEVRKQLSNLPGTELGFVILKNMDANSADSTIGLGTNLGSPPVFVSKQVANRIPNMFIAVNFQKIMTEEINAAATEALKGNWVLGEMPSSFNQPSFESLVSQLRNQYVSKYVDIWESQLANIQPYSPKNLLQVDEVIQNLTNNDSPLLQLLQTLKQNTAFDPILSLSPKMTSLDNLVKGTDIKESQLYEVFADLHQLHLYLQKILN